MGTDKGARAVAANDSLTEGLSRRRKAARGKAVDGLIVGTQVWDLRDRVTQLMCLEYHRLTQDGHGMSPADYRALWPRRIAVPQELALKHNGQGILLRPLQNSL